MTVVAAGLLDPGGPVHALRVGGVEFVDDRRDRNAPRTGGLTGAATPAVGGRLWGEAKANRFGRQPRGRENRLLRVDRRIAADLRTRRGTQATRETARGVCSALPFFLGGQVEPVAAVVPQKEPFTIRLGPEGAPEDVADSGAHLEPERFFRPGCATARGKTRDIHS